MIIIKYGDPRSSKHEGGFNLYFSEVKKKEYGLMDIRRNYKVDPERIKEINEKRVAYWRDELR